MKMYLSQNLTLCLTYGKEVDISLSRFLDKGTESFETEEKP